jgi:hypothetical protein
MESLDEQEDDFYLALYTRGQHTCPFPFFRFLPHCFLSQSQAQLYTSVNAGTALNNYAMSSTSSSASANGPPRPGPLREALL